jgi:hypothetical protein
MMLLTIIGTVWLICCLVAVALCVAASRADQYLALLYVETDPAELTVDFVADFAEPGTQPAPAPRIVRDAQRSAR